MARVKPVAAENLSTDAKPILEAVKAKFGMVPNLFSTIAHYPQALKPLLELYGSLTQGSSVDLTILELANLEVSRINGCNYCLTHHKRAAKMAGLTDDKLELILNGNTGGDIFTPKERVVIEYAAQVTRNAEEVSEELFQRVREFFNDAEIVNLTLVIGMMNVFNRFNGALGVELEK